MRQMCYEVLHVKYCHKFSKLNSSRERKIVYFSRVLRVILPQLNYQNRNTYFYGNFFPDCLFSSINIIISAVQRQNVKSLFHLIIMLKKIDHKNID